MVSRPTNFSERSEPAPDRGGKLQSAGGGAAQSNVSPLVWPIEIQVHCKNQTSSISRT